VQQDYDFYDTEPLYGYSYYRLRQVDFNGDDELSETRTILIGGDPHPSDLLIYPNPSNGSIFIRSGVDQTVLLRLRNSVGQEIDVLVITD
jgi:hypothetical protein